MPSSSDRMPTPSSAVVPRWAKRAAKRALRPLSAPPVRRRRLVADLGALGVRPGGTLIVHCSLSAIGYVVGGPRAVIDALIAALGPRGTLMLMAHSWDRMEAGCRTFDVRRTPVCVGAIPEVFRTWPGVVRSLHPTHSVAVLGPRAGDLVAGHERGATPCGTDTPYDRALRDDAQILLLGVGLESNTAFHTIEALANVPYLMRDEPDPFEIIDDSGTSRHLAVSRHRPGIPRRFAALEDVLVAHGLATRGLVGRATARLVAGAAFRDVMIQRLHDDPGYLLAHPEGLPADRTERSEIDARHDP